MTQTSNFQLVHLSDSQSGKETTVNSAFDRLDRRLAQTLTHNFTSDANYTLVTTSPTFQHLYYGYRFTDSGGLLSTTREVRFPANKGAFAIRNETLVNLNVRVGGSGGGVVVGPGIAAHLYNDGSSMLLIAGAAVTGTSSAPYDLPVFIGGKPAGSEGIEIVRPFTRTVLFPTQPGLLPYRGTALQAATASTVLKLRKNGTSFCTITYGAGSNTPTFTQASDVTFTAGDILTVTGPVSQDATLANVAFTLPTTRT